VLHRGGTEKDEADYSKNKRRKEDPFFCVGNGTEAWRKRHSDEEGR